MFSYFGEQGARKNKNVNDKVYRVKREKQTTYSSREINLTRDWDNTIAW